MLGAPQIATPPQLPGDDKSGDASIVLDVSDGNNEERTPLDCSARGLLPEWDVFELHDRLLRALHHQSFTKPTPIQSKALPPALQGRDVVGVAETVRTHLHLLPPNTYVTAGIGKNTGIWIANPTQAPLAEGISGFEVPQTSARTDPSSHS